MNSSSCLIAGLSLGGFVFLSGCDQKSTTSEKEVASAPSAAKDSAKTETAPSAAAEGEHGHKDGQHGGIIASLGRDSYHVEAVIENDGTVRLYTLGADESRVIDVESQVLKGYVKMEGSNDSQPIEFEPAPQEGDAQGRTSLFLAKIPSAMVGQPIEVTVPNIRIDGERFRLGFQSASESHGGADMPAAIGVAEERELYLVAQGRYTQSDVEANGNTIPSIKFKGIRSAHDMNPKVGDKVCPITETKANPNFTWVIDGHSYEFCCPPCIDEFVREAKDSTEPMAGPETFVKK